MKIAEFIEARLAELEKLARDATDLREVTVKYPEKRPQWEPERWEIDKWGDLVTVNGRWDPILVDPSGGGASSAAVERLIAAFDPDHVIRYVKALRATLHYAVTLDSATERDWISEDVLHPIASIWSNHPDYDKEWK